MKVEPEIWRRFYVPASIPLDMLHDVIQIVMGWNDRHLHEFVFENKCYSVPDPEYDQQLEIEIIDSAKTRLKKLLTENGSSLLYKYDFGDNWAHEVTLENGSYKIDHEIRREYGHYVPPVLCLAGARACPPEDVGGTSGYEDFLKIIKDRRHEEYRMKRQWARYHLTPYQEGNHDPEKFDLELINHEILKYLNWMRPRLLRMT